MRIRLELIALAKQQKLRKADLIDFDSPTRAALWLAHSALR